MNTAPRPIPLRPEPLVHRSIATAAAALVTCVHPRGSRVPASLELGPGETGIYWCAVCGALCPPDVRAPWQTPVLTSAFSRRAFEELVLLLHVVLQLAQLADSHASSAAAPAHTILRNVSRSLSELARLPVVRDVNRLEKALAKFSTLPL